MHLFESHLKPYLTINKTFFFYTFFSSFFSLLFFSLFLKSKQIHASHTYSSVMFFTIHVYSKRNPIHIYAHYRRLGGFPHAFRNIRASLLTRSLARFPNSFRHSCVYTLLSNIERTELWTVNTYKSYINTYVKLGFFSLPKRDEHHREKKKPYWKTEKTSDDDKRYRMSLQKKNGIQNCTPNVCYLRTR